jgi:lysyl-tRNA synthetase class 1
MFWTEDIASRLAQLDTKSAGASAAAPGVIIINDSKTPSGRVHVGALRGVLIHDAIFRTLREKGMAARYLYGVDDFDPVDEIPKGEDEHFGQYIGRPLCDTPAPGGAVGDMADFYMREFWEVFGELGVEVEPYRMRDIYRSGQFNEPIDLILRNADKVRRVYKEVSNSDRPEHWHPFQTVCENCGRIATTEVSGYDGHLVQYRCRPDRMVNTKLGLGQGCGHEGKVSPFDGRGKLPWKLEWVAKWVKFGVTIEGAGKDHSTKGGARDVSEGCLRAIYGFEPPMRVPYEFFLVGGAKMSSSKGIGASARDIADLLPPEVLRFLMIRTKPNSPVNFDVHEDGIIKLFNEFDRYQQRVTAGAANADEACVYRLSELHPEGQYQTANFQLVAALVQLPHLDTVAEVTKRFGRALTDVERRHLDARIRSARVWVDRYAGEEEKTRLQPTLPGRAQELTQTQRAFLHGLADALSGAAGEDTFTTWEDDALQSKIFEVARLTPIDQPSAFKAIYRVLLDKASGPKAGNLLAFLDPGFVIPRFRDLPFEKHAFWRETSTPMSELEQWLEKEKEKISAQTNELITDGPLTVNEFTFTMSDGKRLKKRVLAQSVLLA